MKNWKSKSIKQTHSRWSNVVELIVVLVLSLGLFIYASTKTFIETIQGRSHAQTYNNFDFLFITVFEIIVLCFIAIILNFRGWKLSDFNLSFSRSMWGDAFVVTILRYALGFVCLGILSLFPFFKMDEISSPNISLQMNLVISFLILIVNSIYEEVILIGYLFKRLENVNTYLVIFISFLCRLSFHTYQGWGQIPMVFSMALVFGLYYFNYKKLGPLIIAHAIGNLGSLLNLHYRWIEI